METDGRARALVPDDFAVPRELVTGDFRLEPLGLQHNAGDYDAWMSSTNHIRATPGFRDSTWPDPQMTLEENLADLRRHAQDFAQRAGFTYTVLDPASGEVIGCVYVYPPRRPGYDVHVRSWVRADRAELDKPLHDSVRRWLGEAWPFHNPDYAQR